MAYKYPYIADKKMYAAVMGACKWIRESGYFNKAVSYYADRFGVDEDELAKHIRARQGAGQKGKKRGTYKWFIVLTWESCDADGEGHLVDIDIRKALNNKNAKHSWRSYNRANDYGGNYSAFRFDDIYGEYESKEMAEKECDLLEDKIKKRYGNKAVWQWDFECEIRNKKIAL